MCIRDRIYEANKAVCKMICDGFIFNREDHTKKEMCIRDRCISSPCGISHFAGCLYLFRFQLEENLMGALVGKGKSALGAEMCIRDRNYC